ncbi:histidine kinase dimerization/phosphoacceptor domain -containing protein [Candidatus Magnetomonas plexicatena]|uniref:histidine kinase dimerization/phosphoacceptor domain -containing protein n=1 Tax=Candidatus Magnetomonas plexicatena TaxID=2552947 RepID=UPI001103C2C7|nr:response regulator [Nitrospirales bacterium LBB_01]
METKHTDVVLFVDSDSERSAVTESVLSHAGYTVVSATDVVSALIRLQQLTPSVVLLDAALFDAGGLEFIGILKKHYGNRVAFIILTSESNDAALSKLSSFDIKSFLTKPVSSHQLLGLVRLNLELIRKDRRILDLEASSTSTQCSPQLSVIQKAIDIIQVGVMIIDKDMRIKYVNHAQSAMLNTVPYEMTDKYIHDYMPEQYCAYSDEKVHRSEQLLFNKEGGFVHIQLVSDMVLDDLDEPAAYVYCCMDITKIKEMEKELFDYNDHLQQMVEERTAELQESNKALAASLKEKEVLLKEVHHRVRNNLQIISSMINLSVMNVTDPQSLSVLKSSYSRVKAMTLLHDRLYESTDMASVDVAGYIESLSGELISSYGASQHNLTVNTNIGPLNINIMMQCALILNELISNSLRHAFSKDDRGEIVITFNVQEDGSYILSVSDNGCGFKDSGAAQTDTYSGLQLLRDVVKMKLKGSITSDTTQGTSFTITFKDVGGRYHNKV